jgi:hypothetical protein
MYLLCEAWLEDPAGTLPNDEAELISAARLTPEQFAIIWPQISHEFESDGNGRLFNPKQFQIFQKQHQAFLNGSAPKRNPKQNDKQNIKRNMKPIKKQDDKQK